MTTSAIASDTARHLTVPRTARYHVLGEDVASPSEIWIVVHGYGQLAGRFLRHFTELADGTRRIIAPEALSRFYLDHPGRAGSAETRVGATWMTREDRDAEIADHVAYLDAMLEVARRDAADASLHVVGFSQGVATVMRWLAAGHVRVEHLVLWAGRIPPDVVPLAPDHPIRAARLDVVTPDADEFATPAVRDEQAALLAGAGLAAHVHRFAGTHRMDAPTLGGIAAAAGRELSARASSR